MCGLMLPREEEQRDGGGGGGEGRKGRETEAWMKEKGGMNGGVGGGERKG